MFTSNVLNNKCFRKVKHARLWKNVILWAISRREISPLVVIFWKKLINLHEGLLDVTTNISSNRVHPKMFDSYRDSLLTTLLTSEKKIVFLDTEVYGPRFTDSKILDVSTYYKPTETFQYTHLSSRHLLWVQKGFVKWGAPRLLRTNAVKGSFELKKKEFLRENLLIFLCGCYSEHIYS